MIEHPAVGPEAFAFQTSEVERLIKGGASSCRYSEDTPAIPRACRSYVGGHYHDQLEECCEGKFWITCSVLLLRSRRRNRRTEVDVRANT